MQHEKQILCTRSEAIEYYIEFFKTCSGLHYTITKERGFVTVEFQEPELKEFVVTTLIFENKFYEELKKEIIKRNRPKAKLNA